MSPEPVERPPLDPHLLHVALTPDGPARPADATLRRAFAARRPGEWSGFTDDDAITAPESYRRAADTFSALAGGLDAAGWAAPVRTYGTVHDLVAHLVCIESYVGSQLGLWPADAAWGTGDHVEMSRTTIEAWREQPAPAVLSEWRRLVDAQLSAVGTDVLSGAASWHGAPVRVGDLLVIRTFELWTHADDVRSALGRPPDPPDNGQLRLMTNLAAAVLPLALQIEGQARPGATARLVLTGRGGGTWRCALALEAEAGPTDDVIIVADAIDFCRLTANRLTPDELGVYVEGDGALANAVLASMPALAVD